MGHFTMEKSSPADSSAAYGPLHAALYPEGGALWVRPARLAEIDDIHALIADEISADVGPSSSMKAVFEKNPVSFWRIERQDSDGTISPVGMYGFLPLNASGVDALKTGKLDRREPKLEFIAPAGEKPAALYVWAVVARRIRKLAYPLIRAALGPFYLDVPVFAIAATRGGNLAMTDRGFAAVDNGQGGPEGLSILPIRTKPAAESKTSLPEPQAEPLAQSSAQPARSTTTSAASLEVIVASTSEHLQMSAFIRGATFGAEQACPYHEEFDGNDFCAMHLIGFVKAEPAATLRIRFFANFAKLERLAVLERFRKTELKTRIMERAIEICRTKGYTRLYGQSQERLVGFYAKFGFRPMQKNRRLVFSDHHYIEIVRDDLKPDADAITVDSDPYRIIRPEGRWEHEGVLERSAVRPATNPLGGNRA